MDRATALRALAVARQAIEVVVAADTGYGLCDWGATARHACASAGGERSFAMPALYEYEYAGAGEQQLNEN